MVFYLAPKRSSARPADILQRYLEAAAAAPAAAVAPAPAPAPAPPAATPPPSAPDYDYIPRGRAAAPTWEEWAAMSRDHQDSWECLICCRPAIAGSYEPGRLCSERCAFQKYYY